MCVCGLRLCGYLPAKYKEKKILRTESDITFGETNTTRFRMGLDVFALQLNTRRNRIDRNLGSVELKQWKSPQRTRRTTNSCAVASVIPVVQEICHFDYPNCFIKVFREKIIFLIFLWKKREDNIIFLNFFIEKEETIFLIFLIEIYNHEHWSIYSLSIRGLKLFI